MRSEEQQAASADESVDRCPDIVDLDILEGDAEIRIRVRNPEQGRLIMQQLRELAAISSLHVKFADLPWTIIRS